MHRIGHRLTRKVSAAAARLIVQVGPRLKHGQHVDADNSRKLDAEGKAQIGRRLSASAQDGKAERNEAALWPHSGTVARARQACGVRHCQSLAALNAPGVYVGAAERRFGRFCSPALVYPDRSTGPDFCTGQLFLLSLRELGRRVARSAHVQRGRIVSVVLREQVRLFARVFNGQLFRSASLDFQIRQGVFYRETT